MLIWCYFGLHEILFVNSGHMHGMHARWFGKYTVYIEIQLVANYAKLDLWSNEIWLPDKG